MRGSFHAAPALQPPGAEPPLHALMRLPASTVPKFRSCDAVAVAGCEKHHGLRDLTSRPSTHAYACNVRKKLRLVRQSGEVGKGSKEARPSPIRQTGPHSLLGALPSRACLAQLGRPGLGQADELLAPVLPGADGDPAGVDQWA